ncbi:putative holin-like toxin [Bacillus vallismortis]|nr:putative holin-like toxin [Bacillus vallismortis]MCY7919296.1 putative holin-like toxin [Bacillus vallismortis]MCY8310900.1 putative holin-like toxin [Bacillus vallismortis]MCY8599094.1 putative holin-like toxin [Bacillus vallismortis]MEC1649461.1 putative holin-like toxin [Bacillus vallismortis]
MSTFQALMLILAFGSFIIALLTYINKKRPPLSLGTLMG